MTSVKSLYKPITTRLSVPSLVSPEFLLRQVELHVFIFLVLFVQPPQHRVRRLIAGLLHKRVDILLKIQAREKESIKQD